jgi:tetratricopeptide (TPR) repeat protein
MNNSVMSDSTNSGRLMETQSHLDLGLEMKQRGLERDPFSPLVHLQISLSYWNQRRYDDAIEWANRTLELDPQHTHAREHLAGAYLKKGDTDRHLAENTRHAEVHGVSPAALEPLRRAYAEGGRRGSGLLRPRVGNGMPFAATRGSTRVTHGWAYRPRAAPLPG